MPIDPTKTSTVMDYSIRPRPECIQAEAPVNDDDHLVNENKFFQQACEQGSSNHSYLVVNLAGNAQQMLGNVQGFDNHFFRRVSDIDPMSKRKALYFAEMRLRQD